jgi:hypothetical protein
MNRLFERRQSGTGADDEVSAEYLRVLEICGGEIRQSDRTALAGQRDARAAADRRRVQGTPADRASEPAGPAPKRPGVTP